MLKLLDNKRGEVATATIIIGLGAMILGAIFSSLTINNKLPRPFSRGKTVIQPKIAPSWSGIKNNGNIIGMADSGAVWDIEEARKRINNPNLDVRLIEAGTDVYNVNWGYVKQGNSLWQVYDKNTGLPVAYFQPDCWNELIQRRATLNCDLADPTLGGLKLEIFLTATNQWTDKAPEYGQFEITFTAKFTNNNVPPQQREVTTTLLYVKNKDEVMWFPYPSNIQDTIRAAVNGELDMSALVKVGALTGPAWTYGLFTNHVICPVPTSTPTPTITPTGSITPSPTPTDTPTPTNTPTPTGTLTPTPTLTNTPTPTSTPTPTNTPTPTPCNFEGVGEVRDYNTKRVLENKSGFWWSNYRGQSTELPTGGPVRTEWRPTPLPTRFVNTTAWIDLTPAPGYVIKGAFCQVPVDCSYGKVGCTAGNVCTDGEGNELKEDQAMTRIKSKFDCNLSYTYGWYVDRPTATPTPTPTPTPDCYKAQVLNLCGGPGYRSWDMTINDRTFYSKKECLDWVHNPRNCYPYTCNAGEYCTVNPEPKSLSCWSCGCYPSPDNRDESGEYCRDPFLRCIKASCTTSRTQPTTAPGGGGGGSGGGGGGGGDGGCNCQPGTGWGCYDSGNCDPENKGGICNNACGAGAGKTCCKPKPGVPTTPPSQPTVTPKESCYFKTPRQCLANCDYCDIVDGCWNCVEGPTATPGPHCESYCYSYGTELCDDNRCKACDFCKPTATPIPPSNTPIPTNTPIPPTPTPRCLSDGSFCLPFNLTYPCCSKICENMTCKSLTPTPGYCQGFLHENEDRSYSWCEAVNDHCNHAAGYECNPDTYPQQYGCQPQCVFIGQAFTSLQSSDLNSDGIINTIDWVLAQRSYGKTVKTAAGSRKVNAQIISLIISNLGKSVR